MFLDVEALSVDNNIYLFRGPVSNREIPLWSFFVLNSSLCLRLAFSPVCVHAVWDL